MIIHYFKNNQSRYIGRHWYNLSLLEQEMYLETIQGPREQFPQFQAIALTIYYGALMAIGIPGNLLTCFIIAINPYMRTPPNFFLFNLAATDILTLTCKHIYSASILVSH